MAKYLHLSRIYLNDIELYELMSPKNLPSRHLLAKFRERGILFSDKGREADVRSRAAFLPSDWSFVEYVMQQMTRPDPEEHKTTQRITDCQPNQDLQQALKKIEEARAKNNGETYNLTVLEDGTVNVDVSYTELNYSLAVPYQRRQRKLSIEMKQDGPNLTIRHGATEKGTQIVEGIKSFLDFAQKDAPNVEVISLRAIRDPAERTRFFTELIRGIEGFRYENASHIGVDRRLPELDESEVVDDPPTEQEATKTKSKNQERIEQELKGLINRVSFSGDQVLLTDLYQRARESGYFISSIRWTVVAKADEREHFDFDAGFTDPVAGEPFAFGFVKKWKFKADDPEADEIIPIGATERRDLERALDNAAYKAFAAVKNKSQTSPKTVPHADGDKK